jgi:hypothetical protein
MESTAIIAENRLPGTTAWQIAGPSAPGFIEGYAGVSYASVGTNVHLYVSTDAPQFHVVAYRMGWYQGTGARAVWSSSEVPGRLQPGCPVAPLINMVSCDGWTSSLTMLVTGAFAPGDYLLKLIGSGNQQSYALLTVWDPTSTSTYVIMSRSLTEEAWNTYGGFSFYQGEGPCLLDANPYPVCNRARVVSFDRPFAEGNGSSDFLSNEYPLVRYAEENGLDVTYASDVTVDAQPSLLLQHRALVSLGHDEVWTYRERVAAQTALAHGVNMAFLSAAALVRHGRLQPSPLGANREEVDYRDGSEDPLNGHGNPLEVTGNTWSSPPASWPGSGFVGELYSGYTDPGALPVPFVVADASNWIFQGTGLHNGSSIPSAIDSDFDHAYPAGPMPANLQILAHSPVPLSVAYTNQGKWGPNTYSDMTYYTDPTSKGGVLDTGDNNWINAMTPCIPASAACPSGAISAMTGNVLRLFGQGPAGVTEPSVPNWQAVVPAGS